MRSLADVLYWPTSISSQMARGSGVRASALFQLGRLPFTVFLDSNGPPFRNEPDYRTCVPGGDSESVFHEEP